MAHQGLRDERKLETAWITPPMRSARYARRRSASEPPAAIPAIVAATPNILVTLAISSLLNPMST